MVRRVIWPRPVIRRQWPSTCCICSRIQRWPARWGETVWTASSQNSASNVWLRVRSKFTMPDMPEHPTPIKLIKPIKVMHVIARLNIGGAALYVIQLTSQLNMLDYETQLVCGIVGPSEGDMQYIA